MKIDKSVCLHSAGLVFEGSECEAARPGVFFGVGVHPAAGDAFEPAGKILDNIDGCDLFGKERAEQGRDVLSGDEAGRGDVHMVFLLVIWYLYHKVWSNSRVKGATNMDHDLKIGEVCRLYGITPDTLRHYEAKGLLHPRRDPSSGYRYFSVAELDVIDLILTARTLGIPLDEIRRVIESEEVAVYSEMYDRQQRIIAERIRTLEVMARVTARKQQTLAALTAHLAHTAAAPAKTQTLYLIDVETLFAIEAAPEEMAGLEALSTWRIFVRDEMGVVREDQTTAGFSFASDDELVPP